jgi:hypothetical protein
MMSSSTERVRRWREVNRESYNEYMARYNRVATSDIEKMLECVRLSKKMGMRFSVHHDVPISHRNVCGLHVPANLRVVSERYKEGVGRKFYPEKVEQEMLSANGSPS